MKDEARRMDVLTSRLASGEEALQVFSFEEEARMFLELGALGGDWRVRVTSPGELISVLFCLCASVKRVALDPLPHPDGAALNHLMSMEREAFMEFLLASKDTASASSSLRYLVRRRWLPRPFGDRLILTRNTCRPRDRSARR